MSSKDDMPRVNFDESDKLKREKLYARYVEAKNVARALYARKNLRYRRILASVCWASVFGAYFYTIFKIKQETFLDDFEEPPREILN